MACAQHAVVKDVAGPTATRLRNVAVLISKDCIRTAPSLGRTLCLLLWCSSWEGCSIKMKQGAFAFRAWGGKRKGAGRKPVRARAGVRHRRRPVLKSRFPVHVTWRMRDEVWNLRSRRCFTALSRAFWGGSDRFGFRLVHYSVQGNHVHLLVEARDEKSLSRGMNGFGRAGGAWAQSGDATAGQGVGGSVSRAHFEDADGGAARARVSAAECAAPLRPRGGGRVCVAGGGGGGGDVLVAADLLAGFVGGGAGEDDVAVADVGGAGDGLGALFELGGGGAEVGVAADVAADAGRAGDRHAHDGEAAEDAVAVVGLDEAALAI